MTAGLTMLTFWRNLKWNQFTPYNSKP